MPNMALISEGHNSVQNSKFGLISVSRPVEATPCPITVKFDRKSIPQVHCYVPILPRLVKGVGMGAPKLKILDV